MLDVFKDETFLLYSPSMAETLRTESVGLWYLMVQDNGSCCQSYGPLVPYKTFNADDLFVFAQECEPSVSSDLDVLEHANADPIPYMMLFAYAHIPPVFNGTDELVLLETTLESISLDGITLPESMRQQEKAGVLRLEPAVYGSFPHCAAAFYERSTRELTITAMSDRGFTELCLQLVDAGLAVIPYANLRLHLIMQQAISDILRRPLVWNAFAELFQEEKPADHAQQMAMDALNVFMMYLNTAWNSGQREFSVEQLAREYNLAPETVVEVLEGYRRSLHGR